MPVHFISGREFGQKYVEAMAVAVTFVQKTTQKPLHIEMKP